MTASPVRVAYVVRSWPRSSQTFVVAEVLAVERRGVELTLFSRTRAADRLVQPDVAEVAAPVHHLDETPLARRLADLAQVFRAGPRRCATTLTYVLRRPWLTDGYATTSALSCLLDAVTVAAWLRREQRAGRRVEHLHAHFAHDPALVAMLAGRVTGTPYTFTAHARDLYQLAPAALAERVERAELVVTCCTQNAEYLATAVPPSRSRPVRVVHHGVRLERFATGLGAAGDVPLVVSVGRLVEKKGFPDLLEACALVKAAGRRFRLCLYGDGPLRDALEQQRSRLGLDAEVELAGEHVHASVLAALRAADVFALTPYVTADGDRDGIPNVLVEAMATGLPVVSTRAAGVPELVSDGTNGLLAEPRDVPAIATHLVRLLDDVALRRRLGAAARHTVEADFDVDVAALRLCEVFRDRPVRRDLDAVGTSS